MDGKRRKLAGRYELAEVIGRGGMGTVYRATDLRLGRTVAVKVLAPLLAEDDPAHLARFEREARAAASLTHPGVVAVYDAGADNGTRFIAMERVKGQSVEAILRESGPIEPGRAASIAADVADALAAAHRAGIVHRDIKPGNVMIADDGSVKVLDFGIARALEGTAVTQTAAVLGSAAYMAPEQATGKRVDERSDIYSLGCLLYAMLAGHPPFKGENAAALLHQHVHSDPPPLSDANRRVPAAIDGLVMAMLAKSPKARPQSAAQVSDQLEQASAGLAGPSMAASTAATAPIERTAVTEALASGVRRRPLAAALLGAAVLAVVLVVVASGGSSPQAPRAAPASTTDNRGTATHASGTQSAAPKTTSVSDAAGALTSLVTRDVASGSIDQRAAQQINTGLADVLNSYEAGNLPEAQAKLAELAQKAATLEVQGDVSSAAASPLNAAIANLGSTLGGSPSRPTRGQRGQQGEPPGHGGVPPGHGGVPPGQAKKQQQGGD